VALPEPKPGLVIRYDYLWLREARAGRQQGKDRPACVVAATDSGASPRFIVLLQITHSPPDSGAVALEIPIKVCRALGLDEARSWIVVSEYNVDEWPNAGVVPIPGNPGVFSYGFIPPGLFAQIKVGFLDLATKGKSGRVQR